jgi:hypothetical protein
MKTIAFLILLSCVHLLSQAAPATPSAGVRLTYFLGADVQVNETCLDPSCGTSSSTHPKKNNILSIYEQAALGGLINKKVYQYINTGPCCAFATINSLWSTATNGQQVTIWTPPGTSTTNYLSSLNVGEYYGKGSTSRNYTNSDPTYYNNKSLSATSTALFEATNGTPNYRYIYRVTFNCHSKQLDANGNLETVANPVAYTNVTSPAGLVTWDSTNQRCIVEFAVTFGTPASQFTQNLVPSVSGNPYFTYEFYTVEMLSVEPL